MIPPPPPPTTASLVLGPMLRHVDATSATLWVETDAPATVCVRAGRATGSAATWGVHGHHYALIVVEGLEPGSTTPYEVELAAPGDGGPVEQEDAGGAVRVWPPAPGRPGAELPPTAIRTPRVGGEVRLAFGSCRRAEPLDAEGVATVGPDALVGMALQLAEGSTPWPDLLLMVGDQLYADEPSAAVVERLHASRRAPGERGEGAEEVRDEICTFEEYTWLYSESWSPPLVRWLLAGVATCMLLDDHDLRDDWNTSQAWRDEVRATPWFADRVRGALGSYWVYQHLGNLAPRELAEEPLLARLRAAGSDAERSALLDDFAARADTHRDSARWSFSRELGPPGHGVRLVAMDCRASRRLDPDDRAIMDDEEWRWVVEQAAHGEERVDHLLLACTLPALMVPALADVESWNEAVVAGAWGGWARGWAEKARRATDLEHWAAFRSSLDALLGLLRRVVDSPDAPASVLLLSGDVHCSYTARARLAGPDHPRTALHQLVMSPFRNPLDPKLRVINRLAVGTPLDRVTRALARTAGVRRPAARWQVDAGPWFENGVMTVVLDGRDARVEVTHVRADPDAPAERWERRTTRRALTP